MIYPSVKVKSVQGLIKKLVKPKCTLTLKGSELKNRFTLPFSVYGAYLESPSTPHLAAALGATNADPLPV